MSMHVYAIREAQGWKENGRPTEGKTTVQFLGISIKGKELEGEVALGQIEECGLETGLVNVFYFTGEVSKWKDVTMLDNSVRREWLTCDIAGLWVPALNVGIAFFK